MPKRIAREKLKANDISEENRDYFLERRLSGFREPGSTRCGIARCKERCDAGYGVGPTGLAVFLDFRESDRSPWKTCHRRALWQPFPDV